MKNRFDYMTDLLDAEAKIRAARAKLAAAREATMRSRGTANHAFLALQQGYAAYDLHVTIRYALQINLILQRMQ